MWETAQAAIAWAAGMATIELRARAIPAASLNSILADSTLSRDMAHSSHVKMTPPMPPSRLPETHRRSGICHPSVPDGTPGHPGLAFLSFWVLYRYRAGHACPTGCQPCVVPAHPPALWPLGTST